MQLPNARLCLCRLHVPPNCDGVIALICVALSSLHSCIIPACRVGEKQSTWVTNEIGQQDIVNCGPHSSLSLLVLTFISIRPSPFESIASTLPSPVVSQASTLPSPVVSYPSIFPLPLRSHASISVSGKRHSGLAAKKENRVGQLRGKHASGAKDTHCRRLLCRTHLPRCGGKFNQPHTCTYTRPTCE